MVQRSFLSSFKNFRGKGIERPVLVCLHSSFGMRTGTRLEVDVKNFVDRSCQCSMGSGNDPGYISRHKTGHLRFEYARKWSF